MRAHETPAPQPGDRSKPRRAAAPSTQAGRLLALQRTAGNAAVSRAVEEERHAHGPGCGHGEAAPSGEQSAVQRRVSVQEAISSPGSRPENRILDKAQQAYGMSFDHVRLHTGPVAQRSAMEFNAVAYTTGSDIVSQKPHLDDETIFHELDHVRQQTMGPVAGTDNGAGAKVSHQDDPFEKQSAANGRKLAQGGAPDLSLPGSSAPVQRSPEGADTHGSAQPEMSAGHSVQRVDAMDHAPMYSDAESVDHDSGSDWGEWSQADYDAERSRFPRQTTTDAQPAAGFGKSTHGINPNRVRTIRQDKAGRDAPPLRYRTDNAELYRFDSRPPETILAQGFQPWNDKVPKSLRAYQKTLQKTGFVSATRSPGDYVPDWARQPDGTAYRYVLNPPGGMDIVDSLGTVSFAQQQEVIFWKGIQAHYITRVEKVDRSGRVVESTARGDWLRRASAGQGGGAGQARRSPSPMDTT
ncbi:DUF4157 domain-containing protein [Streptomyces sp. QL37]|uniref:eCIS core domain-containing protein n=1 Tax=Streptomyces sp. QL37 TaxID=2093747 RepID=UPI000CF1D7A3|nr:DUF4157 domain-containing protein [Streptomyces sp. QL37]PPQ58897.1 hypothetical protein C5F59_21275 [Streptomyces sp. QL37]